MVQEGLQRRWELWRWVQWTATGADGDQRRAPIRADPLTTTRGCKELNVYRLQPFSIWSKLEGWKNSVSGCLVGWPEIKKKQSSFWSVIFSCSTPTTNHFSIRLWHATKSVIKKKLSFYMTTGDDQLSGWPKKLQITSQSQSCTRERSWSLSGGLLPVWATIAFCMFSKLMRCTKNCNACSWYWSTKGPNSFPQHPIACRTTLQKLNELGYKVLPPPSYSPDLSPNDYHFFKHLENFLQEKHFHNQQEAGHAFHELVESWSTDFYATGIN